MEMICFVFFVFFVFFYGQYYMPDQKLDRPNGKKYKPRDIHNLTQSTIRKGIVDMVIQDI